MILLLLLLLIDLKDSSLFKIIMATIYLIVYLYIIYIYICLHNNKMKDSSDIRDRKKDFGLLLY